MAWTYSDYSTYRDTSFSTYLSRLRLHIGEVTDQISTDIAADGRSESSGQLAALRQQLVEELREAERNPRARTAGGISKIRIGRA